MESVNKATTMSFSQTPIGMGKGSDGINKNSLSKMSVSIGKKSDNVNPMSLSKCSMSSK